MALIPRMFFSKLMEGRKMEMKIVPAESVNKALASAEELIVHLKKILSGRKVNEDPQNVMKSFFNFLAERVETGESVETLLEEIERGILTALVAARGHQTSRELALVIRKTDGATRRMLSVKGISLLEVRAQK